MHVIDYLKGFKVLKPDGWSGDLNYAALAYSDELIKCVLDKKAVKASRVINAGEKVGNSSSSEDIWVRKNCEVFEKLNSEMHNVLHILIKHRIFNIN